MSVPRFGAARKQWLLAANHVPREGKLSSMSEISLMRSEDFLKISSQFKLGALVTEGTHPVTANLSEVAKRDVPGALKLLFDADDDVVKKFREFVDSGRAETIAATIT